MFTCFDHHRDLHSFPTRRSSDLPVIKYRDVDDAVRRANDTRYGLSGSVWTNNLERGAEVAARLEVGTAYVNQHHIRSEEHTSELQSQSNLVCRLLLEKKNKNNLT